MNSLTQKTFIQQHSHLLRPRIEETHLDSASINMLRAVSINSNSAFSSDEVGELLSNLFHVGIGECFGSVTSLILLLSWQFQIHLMVMKEQESLVPS